MRHGKRIVALEVTPEGYWIGKEYRDGQFIAYLTGACYRKEDAIRELEALDLLERMNRRR